MSHKDIQHVLDLLPLIRFTDLLFVLWYREIPTIICIMVQRDPNYYLCYGTEIPTIICIMVQRDPNYYLCYGTEIPKQLLNE
jgi:hypothetical protein